MKVFINAASVKEGGSKIVLLKLLDAMQRQRPDVEWIVAAPPQLAADLGDRASVRVVEASLDGGLLSFLAWHLHGLPRAVRAVGADLLFSQTNNLPLTPVGCPTVLLEQNAGHFSPLFSRLTQARAGLAGRLAWMFKTWWVRGSVRAATLVTVQTAALADEIARTTGRPRAGIHVIPHGTGAVVRRETPRRGATEGPFRIGYVTKWGVQKDFDAAFEALRVLATGHDVRLVLTLDASLPEVRETLARAEVLGVGHLVENRGELAPGQIADLYDSLDALAFPSLCESFGFPMVEAMARGLPLVVAATPENLEVTGGGIAFAPGDGAALAERLAPLITDPAARRAASDAGLDRSRVFDWDRAASRTLALLESARDAARSTAARGAADLQARTAAHYEGHPFDFLTAEDEQVIEAFQPAPFRRFIRAFARPGAAVAEIGCGPGRGTMFMAQEGLQVTAVDISANSIALARRRAPEARFVRATNLALPLWSGAFEIVVSDGVIHHTPDPRTSFSELVRLMRPGARLYLGVYNRDRYYYWLYTYLGPPVRWLERSKLGRVLVYGVVFSPYYLAHLVKSRGKRTLAGASNFFYDYIITPRASFHSRAEITAWGAAEGLTLLDYDKSLGNVHVFFFEKPAA